MSYLYHHGILGMKWGQRNGPPYPLSPGDHSIEEKRAGWRKSLDKIGGSEDNSSHKGLSEKQKRAIKIGASVAAAALVAYGGYKLYKSGKLDSLLGKGKGVIAGGIPDESAGFIKGLKKTISEPIENSIEVTNPFRNNPVGKNNCVPCSIAGILRTMGYDAKAKTTGGKMLNAGGVLEECFKSTKPPIFNGAPFPFVKDGSAIKFGISPEKAEEMLIKRYGQNARGVVGISWKNGGGHNFSWIIENGKVSFVDFQKGWNNEEVRKRMWDPDDGILPSGDFVMARLDDALEVNIEKLRKYVDIK